MRVRYELSLVTVATLVLSAAAKADPPADLDGLILQVSGRVRVGGNVDLIGRQDFEYDYAGVPITIGDIDGDPTQIQIDTVIPVPDVPCNRDRDFSLSLTGTYDPVTGSVQATGVRAGLNRVDSGQNALGLGVHVELNTVTASLNGVADDDGTGVVTITGLDALPPSGGPSTNLSVAAARVFLIQRPGCDTASFTLNVAGPYGGFTWVATP